MNIKTDDTMAMLDNRKRVLEIRKQQKERKEQEKKDRIKRNRKIGTIALVSTLIAGAAIGVKAKNAYETLIGRGIITQEFDEKTPDFSVRDDSQAGLIIGLGNNFYSGDNYEIAAKELYNAAIANGMTKEEAYIGLEYYTSEITATDVYGKELENEDQICKNAYYKNTAKKIETQEKGASK